MEPHPDLTGAVIRGLGWLYFLMFVMNVGWTVHSYRNDGYFKDLLGFGHVPKAFIWGFYSAMLALVSAAHLAFNSNPEDFLLKLPLAFKETVDIVIRDARIYFALSIIAFAAMLRYREFLTRPTVGWVILNLSLLFLATSMTDYDFRQIVGKPDNVPIVGMLFLVGYFTWLALRKAVINDRRAAQGLPPAEKDLSEQVLVWPDLVYSEMICMILVTALLIVWGVALQAPLEEPASAVKTPNPSKAPWYFLGLQEMLVYHDPWLAGVVLPSIIVVGMMAIPYIDFNQKGNGYYTYNERQFAIITYLFGFLPLWVAMIILGTFIRGPNWNMFGLYEYWDVHKLEVLNNLNLSEWFWQDTLKRPLPGGGVLGILLREWLGIVLVLGYLVVLPPLMAATLFRRMFPKLGFLRYMVLANLLLFMAALPLKMVLRWAFNLKYIVAIPEWFFNI